MFTWIHNLVLALRGADQKTPAQVPADPYWGSQDHKAEIESAFGGQIPTEPPKFQIGDFVRLHTQGYPKHNGWYHIEAVLDPTSAALERPNFPTFMEWHYKLTGLMVFGDVDTTVSTSVVSEASLSRE